MGLSVPCAWFLYIAALVVVFVILKQVRYDTNTAILFAAVLGAIVVLILYSMVEINTQTDQGWFNALIIVSIGLLVLAAILTIFFYRRYKEAAPLVAQNLYDCKNGVCSLVEQRSYKAGAEQVYRYNS